MLAAFISVALVSACISETLFDASQRGDLGPVRVVFLKNGNLYTLVQYGGRVQLGVTDGQIRMRAIPPGNNVKAEGALMPAEYSPFRTRFYLTQKAPGSYVRWVPRRELLRYHFTSCGFYISTAVYYQGITGMKHYAIEEQLELGRERGLIPALRLNRLWPVGRTLHQDADDVSNAAADELGEANTSATNLEYPKSMINTSFVDFLPLTQKEMLSVVVTKKGMKISRRTEPPRESSRFENDGEYVLDLFQPEWKLLTKVPIKTGWCEPFWVFGNRKELYVATESGKLYLLKLEPTISYQETPLWSGKPRRIYMILSDVDSGRTFAFASSGTGEDANRAGVYFELKGKLAPRRFKATGGCVNLYSDDRFSTEVMGHALALGMDKQIHYTTDFFP